MIYLTTWVVIQIFQLYTYNISKLNKIFTFLIKTHLFIFFNYYIVVIMKSEINRILTTVLYVRALITGKARCEYPGEPSNGRIIPLKFWYAPGDKLKITCLTGYVLPLPLESSPPVCLNDGTWSHSLPECIPYTNVWFDNSYNFQKHILWMKHISKPTGCANVQHVNVSIYLINILFLKILYSSSSLSFWPILLRFVDVIYTLCNFIIFI